MNGFGRTEAKCRHVVTFENIQHLCDVHAGGRGRRRTENHPAAIIRPDRRALDRLVRCEVLAADKAAMRLHVVGQNVAERTPIQRGFAVARDISQCLRIFRLHDAIAGLQRRPIRQIDRRDRLVLAHLARAIDDALVQIWRRQKAARGMPDRGLHDFGKRHRPESLQRLAPGLQRARDSHRLRSVEIFVVDGVEHVVRRTRLRPIGIGPHRKRNRALAVDEAVAAVGKPDMRHAAADDSDHHRLDHRQREQSRDRGIDGVAAGGEHLRTGARCQRMIADDHAAAARRGLLLALENRARAIAPISGHCSIALLIPSGGFASGPVFFRGYSPGIVICLINDHLHRVW